MADYHKNFALSAVATAPSPATSGTSLVLDSGGGALFPAVPFNATIWPATGAATSTVAEIVRVTARSTDTLTIVRAREGSSARTVVVGDRIAATVTAKTIADAERSFSPIDSLPTTPDTFDDEFNDSGSLTNWTAYGYTNNVTDIDTTIPDRLYVKRNANTTAKAGGYYKAINTSGTYLVKIGATSGRENYHRSGTVAILPTGTITDSSPMLHCGWVYASSLNVEIDRHSDLSTYAAQPFGGGYWGRLPALYVRIKFNSATSVDIDFSADGYGWIRGTTALNPGWNMDKVGWALSTESGTTYPVETSYDYFRRIA